MATILLRRDRLDLFRQVRKDLSTDAELARQMEISQGQLSRVLNHNKPIGERFIAGMLKVFGPEMFSELFEVIPDDGDNNQAA